MSEWLYVDEPINDAQDAIGSTETSSPTVTSDSFSQILNGSANATDVSPISNEGRTDDPPDNTQEKKEDLQVDRALSITVEEFAPEDQEGKSMMAAVIPDVPWGEVDTYTSLNVGDRKVNISSEVVRRIIRTTADTKRLSDAGLDIYCEDFAVAFSGGISRPIRDNLAYGIPAPKFEFELDEMVEVADAVGIEALPTMQPVGVGRVDSEGAFDLIHTVVKLPGSSDLCIGKLGGLSSIVITDLASVTLYYGSTHIVPISKMRTYSEQFGVVLDYPHTQDVRAA